MLSCDYISYKLKDRFGYRIIMLLAYNYKTLRDNLVLQ